MKNYKELEIKGLVDAKYLREFDIDVESGSFSAEAAISMILSRGWELITVSSDSRGFRTYHFIINHEKL